jgi:hypothetical protein
MKFQTPNCPICGELAIGTLETCTGLALLCFSDDYSAEYEGETKYNEDQETILTNGLVTLECQKGHQWQSGMDTD